MNGNNPFVTPIFTLHVLYIMLCRTNYVRIRLQLDAVASSMSAARKCWLLVNVSQSQVIADLMHIISRRFRVTNNCSLYLDDYWLPPGESTMILKDNDIIKYIFMFSLYT